jgi:hypothetical protein
MRQFIYILIFIISQILAGRSLIAQSYYKTKPHPVSTRSNDEECPVVINNQLIYMSNRANTSIRKDFDAQRRNFFHIYYSLLDTISNSWSNPQPYNTELKTNLSDGPLTINSTGSFIAFCSSYTAAPAGRSRNSPFVGIFFADKSGETWTNFREFEHNSNDSQTIHPYMNKEGNIMYFSSNRAGGLGGLDLYVTRLENGSWTAPQNLGAPVNSNLNEIYPFIHPRGRLYFSSDGHDNNVGGYDIFYSYSYDGTWIDPVKLPGPFNGANKDFSYFVDETYEKGFFTSNRRGTVDIYTFESVIPTFEISKPQQKDNFCFILYEEKASELDTNLFAYEWSLGDGEKVRALEARHCYKNPGKYIVNLNVIDKLTKDILFAQATYELNIERIEQAYIMCPDTVAVNQDIQFNGQSSYFKTIKPGEYYWDFGDGVKGIGASVRHAFKIPGNYTVKLGVVEDTQNKKNPGKFSSYKAVIVKAN